MDEDMDELLEFKQLMKGKIKRIWKKSFANELGCLANGAGNCVSQKINPIKFI